MTSSRLTTIGGIATQSNHFNVELRDREDHLVASAEKFIEVQFLWRLSEGDLLVDPSLLSIEDYGNGTYNVTYSLHEPGVYDILVIVQGNHVRGSPFKIEIVPKLSCVRNNKYSGKVKASV